LEFNYFAVAVSVVQLGHGGLIFCTLHAHPEPFLQPPVAFLPGIMCQK